MQALGYLENIASRHAELVSKYCSQGFSNLHTPTCNLGTSRQDPVQKHHGMTVWGYYGMTLNRAPKQEPPNRSILGQAHWGRLSGQAYG